MVIRKHIIIFLLVLVVANYNEEIRNCAKLDTFEKRNVCRQEVTQKYKYVEPEVEVNIFTLPKIQKPVGDFKEIFNGVE